MSNPLLFSKCEDWDHTALNHTLLCSFALCTAEDRDRAVFPVKSRCLSKRWMGSAPALPSCLWMLPAHGKWPEPLNFSHWSPPSFPLFLPLSSLHSLRVLLAGWRRCVAVGRLWSQPLLLGGRGGHSEGCELVWVYSAGFLWMKILKIKINK